MVLAYHSIFSMYGFWLPNDPRGSYSDFVAAWELWREGGKATKVITRQSVAVRPHNREERLVVKNALDYPPVLLDEEQRRCVADGFADAVRKSRYDVYACAIMSDHVHAVIGRHRFDVERIVGHLKTEGTMRLVNHRLHPFQDLKRPGGRLVSCWAEGGWNSFLDCDADVMCAIEYVRENPRKAGLIEQRWAFEKKYGLGAVAPRPDERAG